ncbi:hypothetical protein M0654_11275 [Rhizobium sp. NTR19]|uniref:DUF6950 domain-containing protein n=1 Tax=Neorhizobium turbinariae TaxID=2937795 RepID=A0ABT0IRR0_9HYPH|nr:hypothetical protein [Neorhizobium turbinariae]MCK8780567.1 hypothetical protein [Neorhizobium turbinariae]
MDTLDAFLEHYGALPWSPGHKVDCCLCLAEWAIWQGHEDPAARFRGTYSSDEEFRQIIRQTGVVPLLTECARSIGASPTQSPRRGDVGVIGSSRNALHQFGAIHDGRGWVVRQKQGFGRMSARVLAAWSLPTR